MKTSELLRKAADVIGQRGHAKHEVRDARGRVCAVGALMEVPQHLDCYSRATRRLRSEAAAISGRDDFIAYNNADSTTGEDVILLFKRAAEAAEADGD